MGQAPGVHTPENPPFRVSFPIVDSLMSTEFGPRQASLAWLKSEILQKTRWTLRSKLAIRENV
jgi:hypothetical protein